MMKKTICMGMVVCILLSLCSCKKTPNITVNETSQSGSIDPNQLQQMMNNFDMNCTTVNEESLEDKNIVPENINESDDELKAEAGE